MGQLYFTVDELAELVGRVDAAGHQAAIHALGDRAVTTTLDALDRVIGDGPNERRHRIDHSTVVGPDLRRRHGEVGAVVVLPGAFGTCVFLHGNPNFAYRTPPEYLDWEWPWRSLMLASPNVPYAWHADFPVFQPPGPISALAGFVTRAQVDPDGSLCEPTPAMAAESIGVQRALEIMTTGSAYALFRENEIGKLAPGMLADLVVLSADPTAVPASELKDLEVWMTMVGGTAGWCAPGHEVVCPPSASGG
jgi:predicted amidohydrolase YtcJ